MSKAGNKLIVGAVAIVLILGALFVFGPSLTQFSAGAGPAPSGLACPDTGQTTYSLYLRNGEDDTADVPYNATVHFFGDKGDYKVGTVTSGTATTATLRCGEKYIGRVVSADGNRGDNARIRSADPSTVGTSVNADGTFTVTASGPDMYAKLVGSFHGVPEFRVWNEDNGAWRYLGVASDEGNNNNWALTGGVYNGTTSENSTISVGAGGRFTDTIHVRANETVTDALDFGGYVLVDAATATWNEPTVSHNGAKLSRVTLLPDEARQFSGTYEYAYKINGPLTDTEHTLKTEFVAVTGQNPTETNSPGVAIAGIGAVKSINGNSILYQAAQDNAAATRVFTLQSITLGVA
jgi:hypothetical protein